MRVSRRKLLLTTSGCVAASAGCFGGTGYVDFEVVNGDDRRHELAVAVAGEGFEDERTAAVSAGEAVLFENLVPRLDYTHDFAVTMALNGTEVIGERYRMDPDKWTWWFRVTPGGEIREQFETDENGRPRPA